MCRIFASTIKAEYCFLFTVIRAPTASALLTIDLWKTSVKKALSLSVRSVRLRSLFHPIFLIPEVGVLPSC